MTGVPGHPGQGRQLLQPSLLADYTYNLAATFMNFYEAVPVLTAEPPSCASALPSSWLPPDPGQRPKHLGMPAPARM